jgi:hypothetical protein
MDASLGDIGNDDSEPASEQESKELIEGIEKAIKDAGVEKPAEQQKSFGQILKDLKEKQNSDASALKEFNLVPSKQASEPESQPSGGLMQKLSKSFNFGGAGDKKPVKNIAKHLLKKAERNSLITFKQ